MAEDFFFFLEAVEAAAGAAAASDSEDLAAAASAAPPPPFDFFPFFNFFDPDDADVEADLLFVTSGALLLPFEKKAIKIMTMTANPK